MLIKGISYWLCPFPKIAQTLDLTYELIEIEDVFIVRLVLSISIHSWTSLDNILLVLDKFLDEFMINPISPNPRLWIDVNLGSDDAIDLVLMLIAYVWCY